MLRTSRTVLSDGVDCPLVSLVCECRSDWHLWQVLLLGVSHCPWECDQKLLAQAYNKMVMILRPDYASLQLVWAQLLFQYSGVNRQFDTGALTRLSDGHTVGTLVNVVKQVNITYINCLESSHTYKVLP